jgi:predicted phosphoribosyltransferase
MADLVYPKIIELKHLRDRLYVFEDRDDAGRVLASMLEPYRGTDAILLGIPSGGVPVAAAIARELGLALDVAVVNKITLPWNSEVGYGGVAFDGAVVLNEDVLPQLGLTDRQVQEGIAKTREKVQRRVRLLRGDKPLPDVAGRTVIVVDDGLATGSTMLVAVKALRQAGAREIIAAIPTGHEQSVVKLAREADAVFCANIRTGWSYAVASAYRLWTDMTESEVAAILTAFRAAAQNTLP